jgi:tRNA-2-methylthio-N6-dimethylallyladenosine synthase
LGQNVNAYNGCSGGLGGLVKALDEIDGLERIRFTTSHPRDMSDALINAFGEVDSLMPYLHLPVQSGSDRVLERMNRRHDVEYYEKTISKIRAIRPDIAISSDFIVGHPGETEADFVETLKLADRVGFAQAYSFKYSARPGTPASDYQDQVSEQSKTERIARLQGLLGQHQKSFNEKFVGSFSKILLDRTGRLSDQLAGRSPHNQSVHVNVLPKEFFSLLGKIVLVRITKANQNSLTAELVQEEEVKLPEVPV